MKPSDSKERVRGRVQRHRAGVTPPTVTPQVVTPLQEALTVYEELLAVPQRTAGQTPEESGYLEGQVEVHKGPQGQVLWRLRGYYDLPNDILYYSARHELKRKPLLDELKAMFPDSLCGEVV